MIASLHGTIAARDAGGVVVDVGGVGYQVHVPASTLARIGAIGDRVRLTTFLYVREDTLALYGFASGEERRAFELLLTVTGVGPKAALGILSVLSVDRLGDAIASGNADLLTAVPGIGKRLASRVVLDLKGKLGGAPAPEAGPRILGVDGQVIEALTQVFGYSAQQAAEAVAALGAEVGGDVEPRIRAALRYFGQRPG